MTFSAEEESRGLRYTCQPDLNQFRLPATFYYTIKRYNTMEPRLASLPSDINLDMTTVDLSEGESKKLLEHSYI